MYKDRSENKKAGDSTKFKINTINAEAEVRN